MVRTALFCSGNGSHLETVAMMMEAGADIEPVFFFSNNIDAPCFFKAKEIWPDISTRQISHRSFSRPTFDSYVRKDMDKFNVELVLFLGYMRVVTPVFLRKAPPIINIHPSLLPAFKGKDAIQQALDAGVKVTGATAHYVTNELDGGPIISQEAVKIVDPTYDSLKKKVFVTEQRVLIKAVYTHLGVYSEQY